MRIWFFSKRKNPGISSVSIEQNLIESICPASSQKATLSYSKFHYKYINQAIKHPQSSRFTRSGPQRLRTTDCRKCACWSASVDEKNILQNYVNQVPRYVIENYLIWLGIPIDRVPTSKSCVFCLGIKFLFFPFDRFLVPSCCKDYFLEKFSVSVWWLYKPVM